MTQDTPYLLTPGPLTTSLRVKRAMLRDWGSRDPDFEALTADVCARLKVIAGAGDGYACVPIQGSGTFAVEAMLVTLVPRKGHVLVLSNGAYGRRIAEIATRVGVQVSTLENADDTPNDVAALRKRLAEDDSITHVAAVHCETTSGLLNPVEEIAAICCETGRALLLDSMSGFGALPLDAEGQGITAIAASANKCLQGVPGVGYVIVDRGALQAAQGNAPTLVLDLEAQQRQFEKDGQWRFTPPTHVMAALSEALMELEEEGGPAARLARYRANYDLLSQGMADLGFRPALDPAVQAPIIVSFHEPQAAWFDFAEFYERLKAQGFAIYAGKMRAQDTFRIGVIGAIDPGIIGMFLDVTRNVIEKMQENG
ncbi:2-aminoethylphosphonate--pyruvate transaminase [Salinihabitans flavidus]|uniref:2-aminoethylphosphonate--pyruvate transaminase n=1 Tax=Salinihabitans flavidus TaxID=569882 RepID=A0A1H8QUQ8_9RHOB|nr:2-aminoethylphosphonate--pyruvate transaminase [Salinihabitans flavidus]SEO57925.1 2-aminoethylphosphonate--pyruvate transaminase [Salinihabitans flavidus]